MSDRPGSVEARRLYKSPVDVNEWIRCLNCYDIAVACVASGKSKPDLVKWDAYLWRKLVSDVQAREPKHITLSELAEVMRWKLARGKARPLQKLVESNPNASVVKASTDAFKLLEEGKWEKAIDVIAALKGVGVATATAIFAPFEPTIPFMADEAMEAAISKRDYTMKVYREMRDALMIKAAEIQSMPSNKGRQWDAEMVGKALWVKAMMQIYPDIEQQFSKNRAVDTPSSDVVDDNSKGKAGAAEHAGKGGKRKAAPAAETVEAPSRASTLSDKEGTPAKKSKR